MPAEGKVALTSTQAIVIFGTTMVLSGDSRFLHLFLLLCWNLIARSDTTGHLRFEFISWDTDHMSIKVPKTKADQTGEAGFPKSVFANPETASLCPFTALGIHIFTNMCPTNGRIFQASIFKAIGPAFRALLQVVLPSLLPDLDPEDHGTHSFRKGAATFGSGFPGGPNLIAIVLRANWSIGAVKDRYVDIYYKSMTLQFLLIISIRVVIIQ